MTCIVTSLLLSSYVTLVIRWASHWAPFYMNRNFKSINDLNTLRDIITGCRTFVRIILIHILSQVHLITLDLCPLFRPPSIVGQDITWMVVHVNVYTGISCDIMMRAPHRVVTVVVITNLVRVNYEGVTVSLSVLWPTHARKKHTLDISPPFKYIITFIPSSPPHHLASPLTPDFLFPDHVSGTKTQLKLLVLLG